MTAACSDSTAPSSPPTGELPGGVGVGAPGGGTGGTGTSGQPAGASLLVGTWVRIELVQAAGDLQRWTTTWEFGTDGRCRETRETLSLVEDIPRTTVDTCSYTVNSSDVVIQFDGRSGTVTFSFSFASFSPDRLILGGFEFDRAG